MENISQVVDILEFEIEKDKSDKDELENISTLNVLYEEIVKNANDINKIIENKENILIILDMIDKNIEFALSRKLIVIEQYRQRKLTNTIEYTNAVNYVNKIFDQMIKKNEELKSKLKEISIKISDNKDKIKLFKYNFIGLK